MTLDFETLHVVALLNTTVLMTVFAGILWAYRSFAATRYWLGSLALHGIGTILLTIGFVGGSGALAAAGSWLFGIAYCVTWQGVRAFYGRPANWRVAAGLVVLSAFVMVALLNQDRTAQNSALALVQMVPIVLIVLTILRRKLRSGGFVVLGGTALALAGNIAELSTNLAGGAGAEQSGLAAWFYLAVTVGAGLCYVGFLLMTFDRLRAQQRNFVALVSHELRAPLGVVAAAADNLSLSPGASAGDVSQRAARIQRTVRRMSALIDNILTGDRLDTWQAPFTAKATFDLNDVVHAVAAGLDSDAVGRVSFSYGDALPVKGDRNLLEIVIINLIQNALKYSAAGSPVTVRLSSDQGMAQVGVTDRGIGILPDDRERIFMKFYRAAGQPPNGSGLGLYIAREIARLHGGDLILAASDADGSTFLLSLPTEGLRQRAGVALAR